MTRKLRISHILVQPVIVWDDGEELSPGPATQPTQVKPSDLATLLPHILAQLTQVEAELLAQELVGETYDQTPSEDSPHIIASVKDWTREDAEHVMSGCTVCTSWQRQASEWLERHAEEASGEVKTYPDVTTDDGYTAYHTANGVYSCAFGGQWLDVYGDTPEEAISKGRIEVAKSLLGTTE